VLEAATSEREPYAGSHVAARVRLMEIASSSGLLSTSPLQTRKFIFEKKIGITIFFFFSFLFFLSSTLLNRGGGGVVHLHEHGGFSVFDAALAH